MFPAWPASGPESNASRTPAHSFSAPAGQNLPFTFSSRSCQSVNRQMLFLQLRFPRRENTRCIFFQHPKPSFPAWPANTSRCKSYYNLQQDNSFHSGASRPIPPATILFIPAPQSSTSQLLSPGLAGRRLTPLHTTFLTSTKHHLPTKYRSPPFFHSSSFFYFLYRRQHPSGLRLSVPTSHHFPNALHFFRPAAASPTRRPNAKRSFARGCSLQGCRWCGRGARVSFFSFFYFFLLLSFLSPFQSPWRRGFAATPSFFFLFFLFIFFFLFAFSFCFFSLYFYSDFLFLFFCPFFLLFLSFYFCSYLCFFCFLFLFLLLSLLSLFFLFVFLLSFYPCFSFPFLSFFLFYFFTLLTPISFLIIQPLADHSFFLFRRQSFPFHPAASGSSKKEKKISAKEFTGVEWPPGSERAAE